MSCIPHIHGDSLIHRIDPRLRIIVAFAFAFVVALVHDLLTLAVAVALALILAFMARIPAYFLFRRLFWLNLVMLAVFFFLPPATPGKELFSFAGISWSLEGINLASRIALRANAIMLGYSALVTTMSPVTLGHSLQRLKMPQALVQLIFFTVRYVAVLMDEYRRHLRAMRMRGFRSRLDAHTFRSYGYLIGNLLVRSFERSERIVAAMKCRGFHGEFHPIDQLRWRKADSFAAVVATGLIVILGVRPWM